MLLFPYTNLHILILYNTHNQTDLHTHTHTHSHIAQSAGAVEYTDCFSAEGWDPPTNECPGYDTKQSDGEVPAVLELSGMRSTPSLPLLPGPL